MSGGCILLKIFDAGVHYTSIESKNGIDPESINFLSIGINVLSPTWVSIQMELYKEILYIFTKIQ